MTKATALKIIREVTSAYREVRHLPNCNEIMAGVYANTRGFQEANAMMLCSEAEGG